VIGTLRDQRLWLKAGRWRSWPPPSRRDLVVGRRGLQPLDLQP